MFDEANARLRKETEAVGGSSSTSPTAVTMRVRASLGTTADRATREIPVPPQQGRRAVIADRIAASIRR